MKGNLVLIMINILLCGNEKVFDGALTELISITNKNKRSNKLLYFHNESNTSKTRIYRNER